MHACPQVVVTGAAGRTGALTIKQLLADKDKFTDIKATVRTKKSASQLLSAGLKDDDIIEFDLSAAAAAAAAADGASAEQQEPNTQRLADAVKGADALVICTSAVPQIKYTSLIGVIAGRLVGRKNMPGFTWKQGQTPEHVSHSFACACGEGVSGGSPSADWVAACQPHGLAFQIAPPQGGGVFLSSGTDIACCRLCWRSEIRSLNESFKHTEGA